MEINLSCPNEESTPVYRDLSSVLRILKLLHPLFAGSKNVRLIAKIGALNHLDCLRFVGETAPYLSGVSAINTVSAMVHTPLGEVAIPHNGGRSGVCGALIYEQGVRMVATLASHREYLGIKKEDFGIVGVGGVVNADDVCGYLNAGADVVQAATGMMWNLGLSEDVAQKLRVSYINSAHEDEGLNYACGL